MRDKINIFLTKVGVVMLIITCSLLLFIAGIICVYGLQCTYDHAEMQRILQSWFK